MSASLLQGMVQSADMTVKEDYLPLQTMEITQPDPTYHDGHLTYHDGHLTYLDGHLTYLDGLHTDRLSLVV